MPKPIGILGGTFDPIHFGHLRLAQQAAEQIKLQEVRFIPAGKPYHRAPELAQPTSGAHRAEMVRRAIHGNELFRLDARDLERSGPTYTYDTLAGLRGELGEQVPLVVLLGADAFALLETWHRWRELFALCHFAVAQRAGAETWRERIGGELAAVLRAREQADAQRIGASAAGSVLVVEMTPLEISATAIRAQLRSGKSPRYLLPDAVLEYIVVNKLYLEGGR